MAHALDSTVRLTGDALELITVRLRPLLAIFEDPGVTSVNYNGQGRTYCVRSGLRSVVAGVDLSETAASSALRELATLAGFDLAPGTPNGIVDAEFPGFRFCGVLAPIATFGTTFSIRRHLPRSLALEDYVKAGTLSAELAAQLRELVIQGVHMLIAGSTDSGKTTFLNALSREIPLRTRVVSIEDTRELMLLVDDWTALQTNVKGGVTATHLIERTMRLEPDRILLGELRTSVAADFIEAANTGHLGCMATIHSNSAMSALERMETLCLKRGGEWPLPAIQREIGAAIGCIAHFKKVNGMRRLNELVLVDGFETSTGRYAVRSIM